MHPELDGGGQCYLTPSPQFVCLLAWGLLGSPALSVGVCLKQNEVGSAKVTVPHSRTAHEAAECNEKETFRLSVRAAAGCGRAFAGGRISFVGGEGAAVFGAWPSGGGVESAGCGSRNADGSVGIAEDTAQVVTWV